MTDFAPETDLEITRDMAAPPDLVWRCWSEPELLRQWFTPAPVTVSACRLDLRPGGAFETTMDLPDGARVTSTGCVLQVIPGQSLVFTDALTEGFRPAAAPFMTVRITLLPSDLGTLYHAHVLHHGAEARAEHVAMGFEDGWSEALAQLEDLALGLDAPPLF
jgi:uncharacterized protein YndB with AHSA1/START domain